MGKLTDMRKEGAVCPRCFHPEYELEEPEIEGMKPAFICTSCGNRWSNGLSGFPYIKYCITKGSKI